MSKSHNPAQAPGLPGSWPLIQTFQSELNRVFDRFQTPPFDAGQGFLMAVDIAETDAAIEVTAEIPGVRSEDLDVSISDQTLILRGEKSDTREDSSKDWRLVERSFGSFSRHIPLGFAPKDGHVDVEFLSGVLTLRIAKPADASAQSRKIDIATA